MLISIDFLQFKDRLRFKTSGEQRLLFDPLRRRYFVQTPEETVRQLVLTYLLQEKGYQKNRIAIEKWLKVNGLPKRFDLLIYDPDLSPLLLVECKAPQVAISEATFRQIAMYNLPLQAQYLLVTNGIQTYCCQMDYPRQSYQFLQEVPAFPAI
ncbi:MAG: type I restriction enzyme HsdR N-terminal domain-containing protein, partial [Bacteroidota bacterium]